MRITNRQTLPQDVGKASQRYCHIFRRKTIFGQRTVRISNGVDFDTVPLRKTINNNSSPTLHLIGVAEVHYWHGYDRLIHGLGEYYRQYHDKEIYFHIVGGVWKSEMYHSQHAPGFHELITHYHIEKQVIFHGQKMGKELDELFDLADFAIGSLARHRSHIDKIKTLKTGSMQLAAYRSSIRKRMRILTICLTFSKHLPMKVPSISQRLSGSAQLSIFHRNK